MPPASAATEAALSRLCVACGLCCNGVLFHIVRLQPADSAKALAGQGMKLKRKRQQQHFHQPCTFLKPGGCAIYADRPQRCRLFECRQIQKLRAEEVTEEEATAAIREVQQRVGQVESLLLQAGNQKVQQPLAERYGRVMALPAQPQWEPELHALQQSLRHQMHELNDLLNAEFRLQPIPLPSAALAGEPAAELEGEGV